ncbi:NAD-dependent epimerase/dehydratase family protein [Nocardiopsis sp. HNM0947]|uniref:NAD-dependent epimerase/dehydratase family protein n=1 Tax=Nocardiopsis coralli TaxID=2772213 RepID=A0ABR9PAE1_9ACTN|nr:NAD-dependent epimerase/dehydratase family protein [Nocardiopsis coralli]MBE3000811.1 NAD-dependent epimerase/dehydratase family protein [Nocardiopsis coralli]
MSTQQRHVVLGAGPAGRTLARRLAADGAPVRIVSRNTVDLGPAVESRAADLMDPEQALAATEGAAVIHHCVNVPYQHQVESMPRLARSITAAAARHGARLVVLDTLYPYGESDGEAITEATPWAATSRKGRMRAELDRYYLDRHTAGDVRVVLGRSADFFGPEVLNSTLGGAFFPGALTGEPVLAFGDIALPHSYTFMPDVAAGMTLLGEAADDAWGRVWHLPTVPAVSTEAVHEMVAELVGRPLQVTVLPEARPYGPFDAEFMAEYAEMFYQHLIPQNMVSTAFESRFGVAPTPLRQALALTLDRYSGRVRPGAGHR